MKVYLCGAHSSGKSTLCRYVSEKYGLPMITEAARSVLSEKELHIDELRNDIDTANRYQMEVFFRQMQEEKKYDRFVADRSAIDCLAYSAEHTTILHKLLINDEFKQYTKDLHNNNTIIFFVRPSKATMKQDGVREQPTWDGIVSIDGMIKFALELFEMRYFQIDTDSMKERIRLVNAVMSLTQFD